MEMYDFAIYGVFAGIIGRLFFPSEKPAVSLMTNSRFWQWRCRLC